MYHLKNLKIKEFQIHSAKNTSFYAKSYYYSFVFEPLFFLNTVEKPTCYFSVPKNDTDSLSLTLNFILEKRNNEELEQQINKIRDYFCHNNFFHYFFDTRKEIDKSFKKSSVFQAKGNLSFNTYAIMIKVKGTAKIDIKKAFYYLKNIQDFSVLKDIKNETINKFFFEHSEMIHKQNQNDNSLKNLTKTFDINSTDFYNALKLKYLY